jgi:short-subunit dehydrogenase
MRKHRFQTVVITGATAGVGRALATRFARDRIQLGLIARDAEALRRLQRELEELGAACETASADVAKAGEVDVAADAIAARFGAPDLWINNAMVTVFSPVADITPEEFRRVTEVTYLGVVHGTMAALRQMRRAGTDGAGRGKIVQIGSSLAYRGIPLQAAYCGAKHAIRGFTDSLRCELIHDRSGVTLSMMQLPAVNTPQFDWARTHRAWAPRPVGPVMEPEAVAEAIYQAAHGNRREYWIGSSTVKVVLGSMVAPSFLDRYLARHAFEAQDRDIGVKPNRSDNLFFPVAGLHKTRGSFSLEAKDHTVPFSGLLVRAALAGLAIIVLGGVAALATL